MRKIQNIKPYVETDNPALGKALTGAWYEIMATMSAETPAAKAAMSASVKAFLAIFASPESSVEVLPDSLNLSLLRLSIKFVDCATESPLRSVIKASNVLIASTSPTSTEACPMNSCPSAIVLSAYS